MRSVAVAAVGLVLALSGCSDLPSRYDETDAGVPIETGRAAETTRTSVTARAPAPAPRSTTATGGSTTPRTTAAPPTTPAVGSAVSYTDGLYDGRGTLTLNSVERHTDPDPFGQPPDNEVFLVLDVTFVSNSGTINVSPGWFKAQTPDGYTYDATYGGREPALDSQDVTAPNMLRGKVTIDVPRGPLVVWYTTPLGDPLVTFRVP